VLMAPKSHLMLGTFYLSSYLLPFYLLVFIKFLLRC
jgi:hypothetical protein